MQNVSHVVSLGMEMLHFINCTCSIHIAAAHVKERYNIHTWRVEFIAGKESALHSYLHTYWYSIHVYRYL